MLLGSSHNLKRISESGIPSVQIDGTDLPLSIKCRNLGVIFDDKLSWESHINLITSKSYYKLRLLYRHKNFLSIAAKKYLCNSLVLSNFNYCNSLFLSMSSSLLSKVQRVQNSCIRFMYCLKRRDHITPYLKLTNWLNMSNRQLLHSCCMMYKILNGLAPPYLSHAVYQHSLTHGHDTRNRNIVPTPLSRSHIKFNSFFSKGIRDFNNLPVTIKSSISFNSFKRKLSNHLISLQNANI